MFNVPQWEVWKRAETGPICPQSVFELKRLFPTIKKLVKQYGLKYDPQQLLPVDEAMIDNTFKAGVELLSKVGIWCTDTERIIEFTEDEIRQAIADTPSIVNIGEGKEAKTVIHRNLDDPRMPNAVVGPICDPISDDLAQIAYEAYAHEPAVESLYIGTLGEVRGMPVKTGSPFEMQVEKMEMSRAREAARRAGRPGLCLWGSSYGSPAASIGACNPEWGYRQGDVVHTYVMPNLKADYDGFNKAEHYHTYGVKVWAMGTTFVGGLCGGPEGAAIASVAEAIASRMLYKGDIIALWTPDAMNAPAMSSRPVIWATCLGLAAMARHTPFPMQGWSPYQAHSGPGTESYLYEVAGAAFPQIICGVNPGHGGGRQGNQTDYFGGPLDSRFVIDICRAATRTTRAKANEMLLKILAKYEQEVFIDKKPPVGKKFQECNDLTTFQPTEEYLGVYHRVKDELARIGLSFD